MKNDAWTKSEIATLFKLVEEYKFSHRPLIHAFTEFANRTARKKNSVRNFYYAQLKIFENTPNLCKEFNVNLNNHKKIEQKFFSEEELTENMEKINNLLKKGYSVRKACLSVSGGDINKMLRLQNKYHSEKHAQKTKKLGNVLFMPERKNSLSESDIQSLFLGLVKLVKKSAEENIENSLLIKIQSANAELRKSIKSLAEKEREVKILRKKFELLNNEKTKLKEEIQNLRSKNIALINSAPKSNKITGLEEYIKKITQKEAGAKPSP